jgi:hypothetical protein
MTHSSKINQQTTQQKQTKTKKTNVSHASFISICDKETVLSVSEIPRTWASSYAGQLYTTVKER